MRELHMYTYISLYTWKLEGLDVICKTMVVWFEVGLVRIKECGVEED